MRYVTLLLLLTWTLVACAAPHEFAGTLLSAPQPAPNFELQSADGPVQMDDFAGDYVYLYFGYTFCPDICPATLATLRNVRQQLGADGERMRVVMVTVDPERDTAERLAEYVGYFDADFVGLTGDKAAIDAAAEPFGVFYQRNELSASAAGYLIDHTSRIYLIDPAGNARVAYPHGVQPDALLSDLRYLMDNES